MATVEREIRQLSSDQIVPGGVALATLRIGPDDLTDRVGITWSTGADELGEYRGCIFQTREGDRFALIGYDSVEPSEITLVGHMESVGLLDDVLRSLRITSDEVHDRIDQSPPSHDVEETSTEELRADIQRAMDQAAENLRICVEGLQAQLEITRLGSLASLEASELTPRQQEVLQLLVSGLSVQDAAEELGLSKATVANHLRALRNALIHAA